VNVASVSGLMCGKQTVSVRVPQTGSCRERYKSPSYQIKEGECVNVDVTGPGATMALGLMFFNTNNRFEV